jgi:hypothetical protein
MHEKVTFKALTDEIVSMQIQQYDDKGQAVGEPIHTAYVNSIRGREKMLEEVQEPYKSKILKLWGDKPRFDETITN